MTQEELKAWVKTLTPQQLYEAWEEQELRNAEEDILVTLRAAHKSAPDGYPDPDNIAPSVLREMAKLHNEIASDDISANTDWDTICTYAIDTVLGYWG